MSTEEVMQKIASVIIQDELPDNAKIEYATNILSEVAEEDLTGWIYIIQKTLSSSKPDDFKVKKMGNIITDYSKHKGLIKV